MDNTDRFIDADEPYNGNDMNTYEATVNKQLQRCIDVLSKEWIGGYMKKTKNEEIYIEDVRVALIKSVDTFRMLISPFVKDKDTNDKIDNLIKEIDDFKTKQGERVIRLQAGMPPSKIKDLTFLPVDSLPMKELIEYKATKYKEMFEILIKAYHKSKMEIAALSYE